MFFSDTFLEEVNEIKRCIKSEFIYLQLHRVIMEI